MEVGSTAGILRASSELFGANGLDNVQKAEAASSTASMETLPNPLAPESGEPASAHIHRRLALIRRQADKTSSSSYKHRDPTTASVPFYGAHVQIIVVYASERGD
ncbi:hypothetical protein HDV57DRAFT_36922 [Trichoderma longibrachiatum]